MPGTQPRKTTLAKLMSSLIRGTNAKAPGAAKVVRVQRGTQKSG